MLKLYHFDRSPYGWKVRIVLHEKGVPFEGIIPQNKGEDPAFAKLNPHRLTPVLVLEDGRAIYESTVINEYLEEAHPVPAMLPSDPWERARVRMIEDGSDQYLSAAIRAMTLVRFEYAPPHLVRRPTFDLGAFEAARARVLEHLDRLEAELAGRRWFGGEIFSLADAGLVPVVTGTLTLQGIVPERMRFPRLADWAEEAAARPACRAASPKQPTTIREP